MARLIDFLFRLFSHPQPLQFEPVETNWPALRSAAKAWRLEADKRNGF